MINEYVPLFDEADYTGLYESDISKFLIENAKQLAESEGDVVDKEYHIALILDIVDLIANMEMMHSDLIHYKTIVDNLHNIERINIDEL